jgi:hypothetical protein
MAPFCSTGCSNTWAAILRLGRRSNTLGHGISLATACLCRVCECARGMCKGTPSHRGKWAYQSMSGSKLCPGSAQDCRPESLHFHGVGQVLGEIVCSRKVTLAGTLVGADLWQRAKTTFESRVPPMGSAHVCGFCGGSTRDVAGIHFCNWKSLCLIFQFDPAPIAGLLALQFRLPIELHACPFPFYSMSNSVHQNVVEQAWRRASKLFFLLVGVGALRAGPGAGLRVMLLLLLLVQRTKGEGGGGCVGWNVHFLVCSLLARLAFCDGQPVCAMHGRQRAGRTLYFNFIYYG